ncbi:hypothetical protein B1H10_06840 [candidate division KSB1 bacterium 4484_188]|nr:MAG: hypothetical protein B1H10_06840 [candidate division KSB1 bacterium 4484_188]
MSENKSSQDGKKVLILRSNKCRKSDAIVNFLEREQIPHRVKILDKDPEAQNLAQEFHIQASPGIIINNQSVNPYNLVERCQVKDRENTKRLFRRLLAEED